jgi:hypothetical protein
LSKERKIGPNLHTHQAGSKDLEKTTVRSKKEVIEEQKSGPGFISEE